MFVKVGNFCDFLFANLYTNFRLKGMHSKMKEFAFRVNPFSERKQTLFLTELP